MELRHGSLNAERIIEVLGTTVGSALTTRARYPDVADAA